MRLWSLHPKYLDPAGLVALWREALLAQKVLCGQTRGYRRHPQLDRFRAAPDPLSAIGAYLDGVAAEARRRHYEFDDTKIGRRPAPGSVTLNVTRGQLTFEVDHLVNKLADRAPELSRRLARAETVEPHPVFTVVDGGVEPWEKGRSQE